MNVASIPTTHPCATLPASIRVRSLACIAALVALQLAALLLATDARLRAQTASQTQARESVLDRIVHIEPELLLEIPRTPRWEEQLDLTVRRVLVGDAELYVEEDGAGVPVVLINGGPGGTHHAFHPWFDRAAAYARVIYYDQRGCGLSDYEPGEAGYSVDQAVADLDALRVALGIEEWVLAGFSYGGFLAQYYATVHPERVAGLVLVGAGPGMWTDLGSGREYDYISAEEERRFQEIRSQLRQLREARDWSYRHYTALSVYNHYLNGDWKRQHFYRPSPEDIARIALYGWVQDERLRGPMNSSQWFVDLTGAFEQSPIPTLIVEGKWDLTWGDQKATILSRNHPNARMTVVANAGHSVYDENPDAFFAALEGFVRTLSPLSRAQRERYVQQLDEWRTRIARSLDHRVLPWDWGITASRSLAETFRAEQLDAVRRLLTMQRIGFALYDVERYGEALQVFSRFEQRALAAGDWGDLAVALIWQGHMLDLLGRREEALARYRRVVALGVDGQETNDQYGMRIRYLAYAAERIETPFRRIENRDP